MTDQIGHWLSILEYATAKKKSISTIRRSIKANHLKYKMIDGRYYIYTLINEEALNKPNNSLEMEVKELKFKLNKLMEENSELKMLVKLYEERSQLNFNLELPEIPLGAEI